MRPHPIASIIALCCAFGPSGRVASAQQATGQSEHAAHPSSAAVARLQAELELLKLSDNDVIPPADSFTFGNHMIVAGLGPVHSSIGVANGSLDVSNRVEGNAIVIGGDIRVHKGGEITGDAIAIGGHVVIDGGLVDGELRSLSDVTADAAPATSVSTIVSTWAAIKLVAGWFAVLLIIGIGVMIFAEGSLDGVVLGLERGLARSFWVGLLGQLLALPLLVVLIVALAVTLLGILLIPFAIVAYAIAAAGLITLGFLAVARLSGGVFAIDDGAESPRGAHFRGLVYGLSGYLALWLLAAAFTWNPLVGTVLRGIALAVTWVAATVGLGATLLSRAGTNRPGTLGSDPDLATGDLSWQTPTPVAGIAAARRPAPQPSRLP